MTNNVPVRPTTIKVISIIAVVISLVLIIGAILEVIVYMKIGLKFWEQFQSPEYEEFKSVWSRLIEFFFASLHIIAIFQALAGSALALSTFSFYRLKQGSESLLLKIIWIGYAFLAFFTTYWLVFMFHLSEMSSDERGPTVWDFIIGPGIVILINICSIWAVVELKRHLKSNTVQSSLIH